MMAGNNFPLRFFQEKIEGALLQLITKNLCFFPQLVSLLLSGSSSEEGSVDEEEEEEEDEEEEEEEEELGKEAAPPEGAASKDDDDISSLLSELDLELKQPVANHINRQAPTVPMASNGKILIVGGVPPMAGNGHQCKNFYHCHIF